MPYEDNLTQEECDNREQSLLAQGYIAADWFDTLQPGEYAKISQYEGGENNLFGDVYFNIKYEPF